MSRHVLLCALALGGCIDFESALTKCRNGEGRCAPDGGAGGASGGSSGGGGGSGGGRVDAADAGFCYDAFCWENPLPQGNELLAVWGSAADDVWAAGWADALMHWDGTAWTSHQRELPLPQGGSARIEGLWGDGAGYRFATSYASEPFERVSGTWRRITAGPLPTLSVVGSDAQHLWATSTSGALHRRIVNTWSSTVLPMGAIGGPLALRSDGLLAVGYDEFVFTCDAGACMGSNATLVDRQTVHALGLSFASGPLVLQTPFEGTFSQTGADGGFVSIAASPTTPSSPAAGFAWLADGGGLLGTDDGRILQFGAGTWQAMSLDTQNDERRAWNGLWAAPGMVGSWAVGKSGGLARLEGDGSWRLVTRGPSAPLFSATVTRDGELLTGGDRDLLLIRDGGSWSLAGQPAGSVYALVPASDGGAWLGESSGHVERWSRATGVTSYWDGPTSPSMAALFELPGGALLVGDDRGNIYRLEGSGPTVTLERDGGRAISALGGWDEEHVWAVGENGEVSQRARDGGWTQQSLITEDFDSIWASSDAGVFICGDNAQAWHLEADGGWTRDLLTPVEGGTSLEDIQGTSLSNLWIGASSGILYQWNGTRWVVGPETGARSNIHALLVLPHDVWVVGEEGMILHHRF